MLRRDRWNNRDVLKSFFDEFVDGATNLERPILDSIHAIDIIKHKEGSKKGINESYRANRDDIFCPYM